MASILPLKILFYSVSYYVLLLFIGRHKEEYPTPSYYLTTIVIFALIATYMVVGDKSRVVDN